MHIAFLTPEYPHISISHSAGIGTSIKNLAVELIKQQHKVTVFIYGQKDNEIFNDNGVAIHKIAHTKYVVGGWFFYRKQLQKYVNNSIEKSNIQLIEAPDWTGVTAFMKFKCPLLIRLHGTDAYFCHLEGRKQKFKNYLFEKTALKNADYITSVSKFTAQETKRLFNIKTAIKVIYNGIDTSQFQNNQNTFSVGENKGETILYFGSIIRKKGVLELAYIFNKVVEKKPLAHLTLLGNDVNDIFENTSTLGLFLNKLSPNAKKNCTYISHVPYNAVKEYIAKSTVVVLPSFAEAFPMTWLEAMAMGKALVTSNIGWAKELMVDGETGYIENPKNHDLYAGKILQLLENKELNATFGENARQHIVNNFSQKIISNHNINYFETIINEGV